MLNPSRPLQSSLPPLSPSTFGSRANPPPSTSGSQAAPVASTALERTDKAGQSWVAHQRRIYARRYRHFRALHDFLRYDGRYRLFLMEEIFRAHDIPFERQRVFELGFGTGSLLLRFDTTSTLHGSEISASAVEALTLDPRVASYAEASFKVAQPDGTPTFPGTNYDLVAIASHVLEHVPDDREYLRLLAERTRPDGYGLFFLPLERPRHNPDHARTYTAAGFSRLLQEAGFTPVHVSENFRYGSHLVQVINWPSRARIPVLGHLVEALKTLLLALPPTSFVRLVEQPLARLHVAPYQLMVLAQKREPSSSGSPAVPPASTQA